LAPCAIVSARSSLSTKWLVFRESGFRPTFLFDRGSEEKGAKEGLKAMKSDFLIALTQLAAERNLPREMVLSAIEAALASAYRKDNVLAGQNIAVRLNPGTGDVRVYVLMDVVKKMEDPRKEITLAKARKIKKDIDIGDTIEIESTPYMAGRIAAQTAKQVVMQRLREAERELVFEEYADRSEDIVTASIQRVEGHQIVVDLGRTEAILPEREQVFTERYRPGQKMKVYIVDVGRSVKGPEIIVSRSHRDLLRRLFEVEVPEIYNGIVEIKAIAREAGSRSKVAVWARQDGVDAVGSCVGLRGIRIQNIVNELQGEKIDVVQWNRDPSIFISSALNPSNTIHVELNENEKSATVVVQDKQLSLAIGKEGQNARLAAKLTNWKIDILSSSEAEAERLGRTAVAALAEDLTEVETQEPEAVEAEVAIPMAELQGLSETTLDDTTEVPEAAVTVAEVEEEGGTGITENEERPDTAPSVTPEEYLMDLPTLADQPEESDILAKDDVSIPLTDDIWKVPQLVPITGSQIRFAEDILGGPRDGESRRRGRRGKGGIEETGKARRAEARRRRSTSAGPITKE